MLVGGQLTRVVVVDRAHRSDALTRRAARPRVQVRHQPVTQPQVRLHRGARVTRVAPRLLRGEARVRRVQAVDGGEAAQLEPARRHRVVAAAHHVPSDVVGPPEVADVGGRGREARLEAQGVPADDRVPGEAHRGAVARGVGEAREGHWAATLHATVGRRALAARVEVVDVVEHPQRVQAGNRRGAALLPVQPPEVHALVLQGVVEAREIGAHEVPVGDVEGHVLPGARIQAQVGADLLIGPLVAAHPLSRVHVERGEHAPLVQAGQEGRRVREQLPVPGVAGPSRADRRVDVGDVPVHVDDGHGEGQLLGGEAVHERQVLLVAVGVVAAPPVAQQRPRDEGARPGEAEEVPQRLLVVLAVAEHVEVLRPVGQAVAGLTGLNPLVLGEQQRGRVVQGGDAVETQQARTQGDGAVGLIEGAGGAAQVRREGLARVPHVAVVPGAAVGVQRRRTQPDTEPGGGEAQGWHMGQVQVLGDDLHAVLAVHHPERRRLTQVAVDDQLGGGVGEDARGGVLHADEPRGEHREPVAGLLRRGPGDDRLRAGCGWTRSVRGIAERRNQRSAFHSRSRHGERWERWRPE